MVSTESQAAMDAAKQAVAEFMSKNGRHNTTVHERVAPAIYHETITRTEHEDLVTVIEKEITQDHYHTSIQPITDAETLEEQHHHNQLPVENRTFQHDDPEDVRIRLTAEREKFRDEVQRVEGEHTQSVVATLNAEHIHHHVHEIIQPVVNKHIIEPHVIHSTVFIREIHHNAAKHHTLSALPAVTMADFKKQGGVLIGREERWDSFEGEPRSVGGTLGAPHAAEASGEQAASNTSTAPAAASQPSTATSERRASLQVPERQSSQAPTTSDKFPSTPSAQAVTEARKLGEGPAASSQQSQSQAAAPSSSRAGSSTQQAQQPGRWSLLPMHLARSAGEGQLGHTPPRSALRVPQTQADSSRSGSVARAKDGQQQQDQSQRRGS